jgi:hypothetical protein
MAVERDALARADVEAFLAWLWGLARGQSPEDRLGTAWVKPACPGATRPVPTHRVSWVVLVRTMNAMHDVPTKWQVEILEGMQRAVPMTRLAAMQARVALWLTRRYAAWEETHR